MMPSSLVRHSMTKIGILLIAAVLIAGMVGCSPAVQYTLTVGSSKGGEVIAPGEGTFTYPAGTSVSLVAEAEEGYCFARWCCYIAGYVGGGGCGSGDIEDIYATTTTVTVNYDCIVTAHFAEGIRNWYDLDAVRDNLYNDYVLMNSLDSTTPGYEELASPTADMGRGWQPIGDFYNLFQGIFDGQGYEIRDLFINRPDEFYVGLFSYIGGSGSMKNIGLVDATVTGLLSVGSLVGYNAHGTVSKSHFTGSVTGIAAVGGLVGSNEWYSEYPNKSNVSACYSSGNVTGEGLVGGLVGKNYGTVSNSYSTGNVTGQVSVGGLVGYNYDGTVSDSYSSGNVIGESAVGGLVGKNYGTVNNAYSTGNVSGNESVGGLVGYNLEGTVSDSFWDTETSGQATSDGGIGKNTTEMQNMGTFSGAGWNIIAVALNETNPAYIWNIADNIAYPFLSWQWSVLL